MTVLFLVLFIPWAIITIIALIIAVENINGYKDFPERLQEDKDAEERVRNRIPCQCKRCKGNQ